ncbi:ephexin-1 isoform X2 [Conger conger]|uniref:ephexin-1 isoform X2 n=1 Tax=Conger conger TaxID=82655 RepID=UPI002A5A116B|nr:ephexin-1 isoform X2 [Conger conger]
MSLPQPAPRSQIPMAPKPVPKPRPPIPSKPSPNGSDCPTVPKKCSETRSSGKVKRIVSKFTEQGNMAGGGGTEGARLKRGFKRFPTIKPKPQGRSKMGEQPPPLPLKNRNRSMKRVATEPSEVVPEQGESMTVSVRDEGRRSAPDGREVLGEVQMDGGVESEAEQDLDITSSLHCEKDCSCLCHLERPGMRLVWVPVEAEDDEVDGTMEEGEINSGQSEGETESGTGEETEEEEEEEEEGEGEEEEEEEKGESGSSGLEEGEGSQLGRAKKEKFQKVLGIMVSEQARRRSMETDVVPQVMLASYTPHFPHTQTPILHNATAEEEEDPIYEDRLHLPLEIANPATESKLVPVICFTKPPRGARLLCPTDTRAECVTELEQPLSRGTEDMLPAIPDRAPKSSQPSSVPRGIPLPQPSPEEWTALHRSPPLQCTADSSLLCSPRLPTRLPLRPQSPILPRRPPPPPPKTGQEVRRLSDQSLQSTQQRRDIEEDGGSDSEREEQQDPKNLLRGLSVDLKSQLLDEPLYQTYRDTVIHKEIKRQTVCRNISKASVDFQMDWGVRRGTDPERRGTASSTQNTLWQQLPSVRDSGILETLSPVQRQHQESMFEVLTSEASYLRSLRVLIDHFMESRDLEDTLIIREKKILFSNIVRVCETSESFLTDLEERIEKSVLITDICDIIYYHAQHKFPVYIDYVRNQIYQEKTYTTLMQKNGQFSAVIARLQESPQCQRLPFMSFLLLPFQRITRIKMLIENILKRTQEGTKEEETTSKALAAVSKIIEECNSEVGKMRQMEELIHIAQTLEFDKMKAIPVVSKNRFLVKRGEVQEMAKGATLFRSRFTPIFLFLFNDLLILTSKKSSERYVVIDHAHRSLVQVKDFDEASAGPGFDNCFSLILLENHQNRLSERLLKVPTQSDKDRWMAAFPDPDEPEGDRDEAVYEEVDCPQVQCIEQYIAQQGDELTLEPTEIVNVIRKGNEGWYEGIRLSDGQKGWFPVGNVLEITNEHVRRRNLRERYRVIHAAGMMSHGLKSKSMPGK